MSFFFLKKKKKKKKTNLKPKGKEVNIPLPMYKFDLSNRW